MPERFELMPQTNHVCKILEVQFQRGCDLNDADAFFKDHQSGAMQLHKVTRANETFVVASAILAQNADDLFQIWLLGPRDVSGDMPYYAQYMLMPCRRHDFSHWSSYITANAQYTAMVFHDLCQHLHKVENERMGDVFSQSEYGIE